MNNTNDIEKKLKKVERELKKVRQHLNKQIKIEQQRNKTLKKGYKKPQSADKLKEEFLTIVAHELKTPLTSISGYIEILLDKPEKLTREQKENLKIIQEDVERLKEDIDEILEYTKIQKKIKISKEKINIQDLIQDIISEIKPQADKKNIHLKTDFTKKNPIIKTDKRYLQKIIKNILNNAIKYTNQGSISIKVEKNKQIAHIQIKDTGKGIAKKDQEKIFERFFQVDHTEPGIGLGLTITKTLVEKLKGNIQIKSKPNKGTTCHIEI